VNYGIARHSFFLIGISLFLLFFFSLCKKTLHREEEDCPFFFIYDFGFG
jgi:hypothetical protein